MKYIQAILVATPFGLLVDMLVDIVVPDRVMSVIFVAVVSLVLVGVPLAAFGCSMNFVGLRGLARHYLVPPRLRS